MLSVNDTIRRAKRCTTNFVGLSMGQTVSLIICIYRNCIDDCRSDVRVDFHSFRDDHPFTIPIRGGVEIRKRVHLNIHIYCRYMLDRSLP